MRKPSKTAPAPHAAIVSQMFDQATAEGFAVFYRCTKRIVLAAGGEVRVVALAVGPADQVVGVTLDGAVVRYAASELAA
jgi:hypothetical protein